MPSIRQTPPYSAKQLDALWQGHDFKGVIQAVSKAVTPLRPEQLSGLSPKEAVAWTEQLYLLQHALIGAVNQLTWKHDRAAKKQGLQLLQQVGALQTATFQRAQDLSNQAIGDQAVLPVEVWANTFKRAGIPSEAEALALYRKELDAFLGDGGRLSDIRPLDKTFLKDVQPGRLLEFTVDAFDQANVAYADTKVTPGHSLLSRGHDVLTAGSMKIFKDRQGNIEEVIVGGFSGHFRPPARTQQHLVRHLRALGVPLERIILTEGEATTFRSTEMLSSLIGEQGAQAQRRAEQLIALAESWSGPSPDAFEQARRKLDATLAAVLRDTLVLPSEAKPLVDRFDEALEAARQARDPKAFQEVFDALDHVAGLKAPYAGEKAHRILKNARRRWEQSGFGE